MSKSRNLRLSRSVPAEVRFFRQLAEVHGCWLWTGNVDRLGYGHITVNGTVWLAHRWSYTRSHGPIPEGLEIDHLCRNRGCVHPLHLEAVTHTENMRRGRWGQATHCLYGHEFTPDNTVMRRKGHRQYRECRVCHNRRSRATKARARERRLAS